MFSSWYAKSSLCWLSVISPGMGFAIPNSYVSSHVAKKIQSQDL
jgi:hypothetical protein